MADLNNASFNYTFNPYSDFYSELNYSVENNIPVIIDFNGGDWGMCNHNTNLTYNAWLNASEIQWDQFNDYPAAQSNVGGLTDRLFCLDNNTQIYAYRHMNVKIAADIVKDFADQYPNLFVGVSTDSEIHLATADFPSAIAHGVQSMYDYNPGMIAEFQQWLQNQYGSITALDTQFNLNFANWTSVDPPVYINQEILGLKHGPISEPI